MVANAVRLAPEHSTVRVESRAADDWALLSVADEGPGIAENDQARVFQRFWRGNPANARVEGRSGLGLAIVRQIAEGHGGEIALVSELGQGSTFTLALPIADESAPPASNGSVRTRADGKSRSDI
ncbi:MAG: ATP-binding protein [Acidobacteria bacterium]|nr:ATP-binding protein [Acidobacteriota bacterium]